MSDEYSAFGDVDARKAPCPECKRETRVNTLFSKVERWENPGPDIQGTDEFYVFQCRGCEAIFFAKSSSNSEDYVDYFDEDLGEWARDHDLNKMTWPSIPNTPSPSWAGFNLRRKDETLYELLHSIYKAMNGDMPILAAVGMRTALDRVSLFLGVPSHLAFSEKLEQMRKGGHISGAQKGLLEVVINAGNAAAHTGWSPTATQLATVLEILEALIRDQFILKEEVKKLSSEIPAKQLD